MTQTKKLDFNSFFNKLWPFSKKKSATAQVANKENKTDILALLQKLGRTLIFPIALLPFAALLNRFGTLGIQVAVLQGHLHYVDWWIGKVIQTPGATVFNNLPLIFAIGTGFGWAKDFRGEAALIGGVFYLILNTFMGEGMLPSMFYSNTMTFTNAETGVHYSSLFYLPTLSSTKQIIGQKYVLDIGVIGGITSGVVSAALYNRFSEISLPKTLSFFGGRRFVPMVAGLTTIPIAFVFAAIWPWIQFGLVKFGDGISSSKAWAIPGAFFYGVINRLLQPFGLHHILNTFLWFQLPVHGDSVSFTGQILHKNVFANGDITAFNKGIAQAGTFQSGYFPLFLGGEPGIALAMYFAVKNKERRKEVGAFLIGVAAVAMITGIDEPLIFSFVFISPLLWFLYAFFTGITCAIVIALGVHIGFGFSAGLIDYCVSFAQSWGNAQYFGNTEGKIYGVLANPLWIWPVAVLSFGMFFTSFYFAITRRNIQTVGREDDYAGAGKEILFGIDIDEARMKEEAEAGPKTKLSKKEKAKNKYHIMALNIIKAIKANNIKTVSNCATRLRMQVGNNSKELVNDALIKKAGGLGIIRLGQEGLQVVIGTDVEHVVNNINKLLPQMKQEAEASSQPKSASGTTAKTAAKAPAKKTVSPPSKSSAPPKKTNQKAKTTKAKQK